MENVLSGKMKILFFLLLVFTIECNCQMIEIQGLKKKPVKDFDIELKEFIMEMDNYYNLSEYIVYAVKVFEVDNECKVFTVGLMFNDYDMPFVNYEHVYIYNNKAVVISFDSNINEKRIDGLTLEECDKSRKDSICNILLNDEKGKGFMVGTFQGFVYKQCKNDRTKTFYENADLIPEEYSIFGGVPFQEYIHQIKE